MVFLLTKRAHYFYDADAIRESHTESTLQRVKYGLHTDGPDGKGRKVGTVHTDAMGERFANPAGRNARNVWLIPTQGRPEAHFATFPDELPRRCILAGTSGHGVCADCGAPWIRQTEKPESPHDVDANTKYDVLSHAGRARKMIQSRRERGIKDTEGWGTANRRLATHLRPQRRPDTCHRARPLHRQWHHRSRSPATRTPRHRTRPQSRLPGNCPPPIGRYNVANARHGDVFAVVRTRRTRPADDDV